MKILLSKESIATIALLMLLSLSAVAGMIILVDAAAIKEPTVCITGSGSVELTRKSGTSETYVSVAYLEAYPSLGGLDTVTITPSPGWGISTVLIDDDEYVYPGTIPDDDEFRVINVRVKRMISVTFDENSGVDDVDEGSTREAYPYPDVGLIFNYVEIAGDAYAVTMGWIEYPDHVGESWDISTDAHFDFVEVILVIELAELHGADPYLLTILITEFELARADVFPDGIIDGTDVSIVANSNPSGQLDPLDARVRLDQNNDYFITDEDVNIVNDFIGMSVWKDITSKVVVDYDNGLVYVHGITEHFSIFGVHSGYGD